jgi:uncharacterized protein (TIGR03437 family)
MYTRGKTRVIRRAAVYALALVALINYGFLPLLGTGMQSVNAQGPVFIPGAATEGTIFGVTASNRLISFRQETPGAINSNVAITGLAAGETIVGIDFRPRTGQLIGISSGSRIYSINPQTGVATVLGGPLSPALAGDAFGIDFNPTVDRIRVVSNTDQNLRLNPDTGMVANTDTNLAYATGDANANANPNVVASAYTDNFTGTTRTTLYGIDSNTDTLVLQGSLLGTPNSPNAGQLTTVGALGVNTTDQVGFDILGSGGAALASLTTQGGSSSSLYTVNLTTGAATLVGAIGVGEVVRDIAAVTRVETVYAVTSSNRLISFNSGTPGALTTSIPITGLATGENVVGIDFRPATGQVFILTNMSRLYTVNTTTGVATLASGTPLSPALTGNNFGFDFNPSADRIRVVSNSRQNLRLNPNTGTVVTADTQLAFATGDPNANATPNAVAAAYTDNFAGTAATSLYLIDSNLDALLLQGSIGGTPNSPNGGQVTTVGQLGVNTGDLTGFDIVSPGNGAFASLTPQGGTTSSFYSINLATGAATLIGVIGGGETIVDLTVATRVETLYAITSNNQLISFNSLTPTNVLRRISISGIPAGETVVSADFRPASGQFYVLTSAGRLYVLDPQTGAATLLTNTPLNPALSGTGFDIDFNPTVDRIRLISDTGQNLRLQPETAVVAGTDMAIVYATGDVNAGRTARIVGAAYNNNFIGAQSTTLYAIDSANDVLVRVGSAGGTPTSPNTGQLFTVGSLGVDTTDVVDFDISDSSGLAYATLTTAQGTRLYQINLATGAATLVGGVGSNDTILALAVANTVPISSQDGAVAIVNAASFVPGPLSSNSIAAAFGSFQTDNGQLRVATTMPLPTTLGGVRVTVNGVDAQLLAVSPNQINFVVPTVNVPQATVVITNSDGSTRIGMISIAPAAPGIFTASGNGRGTAAAFYMISGSSAMLPVIGPNGTPVAIPPGSAQTPTSLILYTTGIRNTAAANPNDANGVAEAITVTINGVPATVTFAGPAPGFTGLDQVNVTLPPSLSGVGTARIQITANGQPSNIVSVQIGGAVPLVTSTAIAFGQTVTGTLTTGDQVQDAGDDSGRTFFFDSYSFTTTAPNTPISIDLRSSQFDPTILVYRVAANGTRTLVAMDDQTGGIGNNGQDNDNSLLLTVLPEPGNYLIFVTSANSSPSAIGTYTLRLGSNTTNPIQSIAYGANLTTPTIFTTDLQTSAGVFYDTYSFSGQAGDRVEIRMSSSAFDSFLILNKANGEQVAFDDDSGNAATGEALIRVTLPETGTYIIIAMPFEANRTGAYTLSLTRTGTSTPAVVAESTPRGRSLQADREARNATFDDYSARRVIETPQQ